MAQWDWHDEIMEKGIPAQAGLLALVGEYVRWFEDNFGTSLCRERSGVDFFTKMRPRIIKGTGKFSSLINITVKHSQKGICNETY